MTKCEAFSKSQLDYTLLPDSIEKSITNSINATLIWEFYQFMKNNGTPESLLYLIKIVYDKRKGNGQVLVVTNSFFPIHN
jgi:hypothetical protein